MSCPFVLASAFSLELVSTEFVKGLPDLGLVVLGEFVWLLTEPDGIKGGGTPTALEGEFVLLALL